MECTPNFFTMAVSSRMECVRRFNWTIREPERIAPIFVRRAYDHAIGTLIYRRCDHRSREGVICLEFHNRPNHDASCQEDLFEQRELRQEIRVNTVACLIVWPYVVSERLDD